MSLLRVVEDVEGNIYLVTDMLDKKGNPIDEPALAESVVIRFRDRPQVLSTQTVAIQTVQ